MPYDERRRNADHPHADTDDYQGATPSVCPYKPIHHINQHTACTDGCREKTHGRPSLSCKPIGNGCPSRNGKKKAWTDGKEDKDDVKCQQWIDLAKEDKPEATQDAAHEEEPPGTIPVGCKTNEGRSNASFYASQGGCKGCRCIGPAKLIHDRIEEGCKAVEESACTPKMN